MVEVTSIENKLRENKFRYFGYICHKFIDMVIKKGDIIINSSNTIRRVHEINIK